MDGKPPETQFLYSRLGAFSGPLSKGGVEQMPLWVGEH